jgi:hypothetical protein
MGNHREGELIDKRPSRLLKKYLGKLPFIAELYDIVRPAKGELPGGFRIDRLASVLPGWVTQVEHQFSRNTPNGSKRILIVSNLRWWMEFTTALALVLRGRGHDVHLAYLPYRTWFDEVDKFDLRRQQRYLNKTLSILKRQIRLTDLSLMPAWELIDELRDQIEDQSRTDVQYTLQRESINLEEDGEDLRLFHLRQERNRAAANGAFVLMGGDRFDTVVIPNGSILEFGTFYKIAHHLGVPTVTIEFGEQRQRMWLAQNDEVMCLDTSNLWDTSDDRRLREDERNDLIALYKARRGGRTWENFARQWQSGESKDAPHLRKELGLDPHIPIALLCTNVVGDSLALGRQVFTSGMADWLAKTVRHFVQRQDAQLVVRVHPGELLGAGHPSVEIVHSTLPTLPPHVTVVPPDSNINTYDLIDMAHVGLVYTTTVGMEMAMNGVPVIVSGSTHYRQKGFTFDPETLGEYTSLIDEQLKEPIGRMLPKSQIDLAWKYAHRFFFDYPFQFPWHLIHFWDDIENRSIEEVLSDPASIYQRTFDALVGEPIRWPRAAMAGGD